MGIALSMSKLRTYKENFERINKEFRPIDYALNNNQIACAIAAIAEKKKKRIFLTVPPGKGKSRIISAIIAYKALVD